MTRLVLFLICSLFSMLYACQPKEAFIPIFTESKETTHKISKEQAYTFGYLEVLENRNNPKSDTIKLPIYIFKSRNPSPQKDPIIYTVGGPGYTSMGAAPYMNYYKYLDDRDFILFEQRGTQFAQPHLDCPEWSEAIYLSHLPNFDKNSSDSLFEKAALNCRERLSKQHINFNNYNTNAIAADIADLVKALKVDTYNLLTISYSTKIAQVLIRDYPKGIRSVVMDSPLPLEVNYEEESLSNLLAAVDKLLLACEADSICSRAFPAIKSRFLAYLAEKTLNPLKVTIQHPKNGNEEVFYLKGEDLITVFTSAYTGNVQNVPFEINKLLNNDLGAIKQQLSKVFDGPSSGAGIGMRLSVWCAEEDPFTSQEAINAESTKYPQLKGATSTVFRPSICEIWRVKKVANIENVAVKSAIPIFLISGEYDNETPPKWAAAMKKNLSNSYHSIFKGWKHTPTTNWNNQCAMQAANDFFNNPNKQPNPACFEEIKTPAFKTE